MNATLKPALESLDKALNKLETAVEKKLRAEAARQVAPELDLSARNEKEVNRKIAAKLDQTIHRLETILSDDGRS